MLVLHYEITSELVNKRTHKKLMRKILRQAMTRVRQNLPKHFERNAETSPGGAYGYEPRTINYQKYKARRKGHQIPLVFTGRLRREIMANARISATAGRARLRTRGYFPMRNERRREIETISPEEVREIKARMGRDYVILAKRPEYARKRRRKG